MKKFKSLLIAFGLFAVVGTALAFDSKRFSQNFCVKQTPGAGTCTAIYLNRNIVSSGGELLPGYATINNQCPNLCTTNIRIAAQ